MHFLVGPYSAKRSGIRRLRCDRSETLLTRLNFSHSNPSHFTFFFLYMIWIQKITYYTKGGKLSVTLLLIGIRNLGQTLSDLEWQFDGSDSLIFLYLKVLHLGVKIEEIIHGRVIWTKLVAMNTKCLFHVDCRL